MIRLSDGAVLSSAKGEYWRTGDARANHMDEDVAWSPNSRLAIEVQSSKWSSDFLRLYAIGADDKALVLDLQKIIEPAVRKRLRQLGKNDGDSMVSVEDGSAIDDSGLVRVSVLMQIPEQNGCLAMLRRQAPSFPEERGALSGRRVGPPLSHKVRNGGTNTSVPLVPTFVTARAARDTNAGTGHSLAARPLLLSKSPVFS